MWRTPRRSELAGGKVDPAQPNPVSGHTNTKEYSPLRACRAREVVGLNDILTNWASCGGSKKVTGLLGACPGLWLGGGRAQPRAPWPGPRSRAIGQNGSHRIPPVQTHKPKPRSPHTTETQARPDPNPPANHRLAITTQPSLLMSFLAPRARFAPRLYSAARGFSSSPVASTSAGPSDSPAAEASSAPPPVSELAPEPVDPAEAQAAPLDPEPAGRGAKGFRAWLATDGARFRHGIKGQTNWLGETVSNSSASIEPGSPAYFPSTLVM